MRSGSNAKPNPRENVFGDGTKERSGAGKHLHPYSKVSAVSLYAISSEEDLISHEVFVKLFCKSQFLHKSVNLFFTLVIVNDNLAD